MYQEMYDAINNAEWLKAISIIKTIEGLENNIELLQKLGWCYSKIEKYDAAIKCFDQLIILEPKRAIWHYMKGYQYYVQKKWNNAIEHFLVAIDIYPNYLIVRYRLSYAYIQLSGHYLQYTKPAFWKALGHLNECHNIYNAYDNEQKEKNINIYFDICFLHGKSIQEMNGKQLEAIKLFDKALAIKKDSDCEYQLAKTYYMLGEYEKALYVIPNTSSYYVKELLSNIYHSQGKYQKSNNILFSLVKKRTKDYLFLKIAKNYKELNMNDTAIEYAEKATKYGENNYKNYLYLGELQFLSKKYKSAFKTLNFANELKIREFNINCIEANNLIQEIVSITKNEPYDEEIVVNNGIIEKYNAKKGFGFIFDDFLGEVFFHMSEIKNINNKKMIGKRVSYVLTKTSKGYSARNIEIIK